MRRGSFRVSACYIDRWAKLVRGLGTWQAVAFREPSDPGELTVKRTVAPRARTRGNPATATST